MNVCNNENLNLYSQDNPEDDEEVEYAKEIQEYHDLSDSEAKDEHKALNRRQIKDKDNSDSSDQLLPGFDSDDSNRPVKLDDNLSLLTDLGLADITPLDDFGEFQNGSMDGFLPRNTGNETDDVFDKLLSDLNIGK